MNKSPCEQCLKFPICKWKKSIKCRDMFVYLHSFSRPGYTDIHLDGLKRNEEARSRIECLFEKPIREMWKINYHIVFMKGR